MLEEEIKQVCNELADFLIEKNKAYGNSVGEPVNCFCKADWEFKVFSRIDDKLSRIMKGKDYAGDDDILDLTGYLILYRAIKLQKSKET